MEDTMGELQEATNFFYMREETSGAPAPSDWAKPLPLGSELPPVQAFELELLPSSLRPLVEDISDRMQTPTDLAAASAVVALAACVNRRATIQPKTLDTGWQVVCNLWGAIIAPPGFLKSPLLQAVTRPLIDLEALCREEFQRELGDFELEQERMKLAHEAWQQEYRQALRAHKTLPTRPDTSVRPPTQRRLVLTDATFEKLHEILQSNPDGVLVLRDELTGWLAGLDRQGREGERAFFLQGWNGDTGFTVDRIGRGSLYVPAVCVSMLGAIQPGRLKSYLADALRDGPGNDGLIQRFQVLVWPDLPRSWTLVDRQPNMTALTTAREVYHRLAGFSSDFPIRMRFGRDAQELFNAWLEDLEKKLRGGMIHPALESHLSKYRSLMPTLAAVFELADAAAEEVESEVVSLDHARQAAAWTDYLESHAQRVYSCITTPEFRATRELARRIKNGEFGKEFSLREVYHRGLVSLDKPELARAAVEILEECHWIRKIQAPPQAGGGRPTEKFAVNPGVFSGE
jgi:putative DNA primase/helicase